MRVGQHQGDVLAGTRLGLVGVHDQVVRLAVTLGDEAPLHAGGEARTAAAAQPGVLDQLDQCVRAHLEALGHLLVAAVAAVGLDRVGVRLVPVGGQDRGQRHVSVPSRWAGRRCRPPSAAGMPRSAAAVVVVTISSSAAPPSAVRPSSSMPGDRARGGLEPADHRAPGRADLLAGLEGVEHGDRVVGGHPVEELPVHGHHRRVRAGGLALDALEVEGAVLADLVVAGAGVGADGVPERVATEQGAHGVGAHADVVLAGGAALVHRVEGRHGGHLGGAQREGLRAGGDPLGAHVALLGLHEVQHRQQRRARLGVATSELGELGHGRLGDGHQRSTPPITGSMLATAATTSATWPPSHMAATDCRLLKLGSRKCTR